MSPPRTPLFVVALLGTLILVSTSLLRCTRSDDTDKPVKPDRPPTERESGGPAKYDSPQAVFDAAKAAQAARNYRTACDCFTPESQDLLAGYLTLAALMAKNAMANPLARGPDREKDRPVLEDRCRALDDLLAKHGLNEEKLQSIVTMNPMTSLKDSIAAAAKLTAPIKDKPSFIVEIQNLTHAIAVAYTGGEIPHDAMLDAKLESIKREDDRATAQVVVPYRGEEMREPIGFRKANGGWLIDMTVLAHVDNVNTQAAASSGGAAPLRGESDGKEIVNSIGMKLKLIKPGSFMMGSTKGEPDEKPVHKVTLTRGFYIGVHEVTQAQWELVMGSNPSEFKGPKHPVESVSWDDAQEFCRRLSDKENATYRLPTEAEWEYACRAGTSTEYYWGDSFDSRYARDVSSVGAETHQEVGARRPNAWGLYDMSGNVWEWCEDRYSEGYPSGTQQVDPKGAAGGLDRVCRGGGWCDPPEGCRSANRLGELPTYRMDCVGLRLVRAVR